MSEYRCHYIDEALSFNRTNPDSMFSHITFCNYLNPNNAMGRYAFLKDYDGHPINWDDFIAKRDEIRCNFAQGNFPEECKGCPEIVKEAPKTHKKIYDLSIAAWQICNSNCIFCEATYLRDYKKDLDNFDILYKKYVEPYDVYAMVKELTEKEILAKEARIDITGGEPTLYPKFNQLVALLIEYGCKNMRIYTNAIMYSPAIEKALKEDAATMVISLDAGSREMHKKVKGVASYDLVWENIKKYTSVMPQNHKKEMNLKYILIPNVNDNKKELEIWIKLSKQANADCVSVDLDYRYLAKQIDDKKVWKKLVSLYEFAYKKAAKYKIRMYAHPYLRDVYAKLGLQLPPQ